MSTINAAGTIFGKGLMLQIVFKPDGRKLVHRAEFDEHGHVRILGKALFDAQRIWNDVDAADKIYQQVLDTDATIYGGNHKFSNEPMSRIFRTFMVFFMETADCGQYGYKQGWYWFSGSFMSEDEYFPPVGPFPLARDAYLNARALGEAIPLMLLESE